MKSFKAAAHGDDARALLDGWHLIEDALTADLAFETVALTRPPRTDHEVAIVSQLTRQSRAGVVYVSTAVMDALSPVRTPAGIVALVDRPELSLSGLFDHATPLIIVAVDMQDPGNVGAVIRSAEAGGASGVLFTGASADPWGWKALRAAMGSTFRLPTVHEPHAADACALLREQGIRLMATVPRDGIPMHHIDMTRPTALLLGGEGAGLDLRVVDLADDRITIPMQAPVESLNVAVATGVLVYEARRQRNKDLLRKQDSLREQDLAPAPSESPAVRPRSTTTDH
ncbi:MAG TPA: RNA methyltransferase [Vicinamibacterales bacterium]|nr:RNA methyltransferase [Vicinamibacterales bacterium]